MDIILSLIIAGLVMFIGIEHDPRNPKNRNFPESTDFEND